MSSGFLKESISAIEFPHFPTRQQAIVWRNFKMVPVERIAKALNTNKENILKLAEEMGLNIPPDIEYWLERLYYNHTTKLALTYIQTNTYTSIGLSRN